MADAVVETSEMTEKKQKDAISSSKKDQSGGEQGQLKAKVLVQKLFDAKDNLKDVKNGLKAYKVTSEKLEELAKARKEFTDQINEEKERIEAQFMKDSSYIKLREQKLDAEEKIAVAKQDLRVALLDETIKKQFVEMEVDVNGVPMKLQTQVKVNLYFNGREEK